MQYPFKKLFFHDTNIVDLAWVDILLLELSIKLTNILPPFQKNCPVSKYGHGRLYCFWFQSYVISMEVKPRSS